MIELAGVGFSYADAPVLTACDLSVATGERVAVLGESGCGKTTLLRLIAGLDLPSAGTVSLDGRTVSGDGAAVPPHQRGISLAFQEAALWPHLTVRKHLDFGASRNDEGHAEWAKRLIAAFGLADLADRYPGELSGGQSRRVALARAFALRRPRVLLDEPLVHLDDAARAQLRDTVLALAQETACTLVWVTHDRSEAAEVGQRVLRLTGGRLVG